MGGFNFSIGSDEVMKGLDDLREALGELEGGNLEAQLERAVRAHSWLMVNAPPTWSGTRVTHITLNTSIGPIKLTIKTTPVSVSAGSVGMKIVGTPANCAKCRWIQTRDISGEGAHTDYEWWLGSPADPAPILGNTSGEPNGQDVLWDSPAFPAGTKKGWKHFVSSIGVYKGGKFYVLGSITWGFDVIGGRAGVIRTRVSTRGERRGSLYLIRREHPRFRLEKGWIEEGQ